MITKTQLEVIQIIFEKLNKTTIRWAFTGSTNMALQGLMVTPNDIDIQTDEEGAYKIAELFSEYVDEPVHFWDSEIMKSHYGKLNINGIQVEIMGAVQKKLEDGSYEEPVILGKHYMTVVYIKMKLPVLDLEYERDAYQILGRTEKVEKLNKYLGY